MPLSSKRVSSQAADLSREFERQTEIVNLRDELDAMLPPRCEACGQVVEVKK